MTNIREIFAESWQKTARPAEILGLNGPARPGPARFVNPEIYNPDTGYESIPQTLSYKFYHN